jgi:aspartate/tyrosine/aromatic aminotransferase
VYVVSRGRINVAGLSRANVGHVVSSVKAVIEG